MDNKLSELKAAAMAATPQKIDGAQEKTEDGCMECPCCSGDGQVDVGADYCNYDNTAIGVIFYGIGDAHVAAERYFRAANPATVLALLAELEASKKSNAFLKEQLAKLANFNPDWDMLEACRESWREVAAALKEAEARLAVKEMSGHYRAKCGGCEVATAFMDSEQAAIERWNQRAEAQEKAL